MIVKEDRATFTADVQSQAFVVEFSPYGWSKNLICIGLNSKILIASVIFPEEREEDDEGDCDGDCGFSFKILKEFYHEHRIQSLAWGPDTSLKGLPRTISFAAADCNHKISVFTSDLENNCHQRLLEGHSDYVNALGFDPEGSMLASVSDDLTCQLWNVRDPQPNNKSETTFWLSSPGMSLSWHPLELGKLLVGEKSGLLQIFNVFNQQPILSIDAGTVPLMAAHWAPSNSSSIAALAGGEIIVWDVMRPSRPVEVRTVHPQGGRWLRFCSGSELVVASLGKPGHQLKVCNVRAKLPMLQISLPVASGLTWHQHLPYVCIASDTKLYFWKVATK